MCLFIYAHINFNENDLYFDYYKYFEYVCVMYLFVYFIW